MGRLFQKRNDRKHRPSLIPLTPTLSREGRGKLKITGRHRLCHAPYAFSLLQIVSLNTICKNLYLICRVCKVIFRIIDALNIKIVELFKDIDTNA